MGCCNSNSKAKKPILIKNAPTQDPSKLKIPATNPATRMNGRSTIDGKERIDTPLITEENIGRGDSKLVVMNDGGKQKNFQYFDISPKVIKKNKIYHISNQFPVSRPYSTPSDWQKLIAKSQQMSEEELVQKILGLRNRNWVQDQIKLQMEIASSSAGSLDSFVTNRRFLQLREHFNWLVWAVSQCYFNQKFESQKYNLPKLNSRKWNDGFEFKGAYLRVLPYEEAYFVHNEMQALKFVQMELLELQTLSVTLSQQYGPPKENLQKDVILPLLSGVSCAGFYLYGSPIIYTQELNQTKEFYQEMSTSKVGGHSHQNFNSVQNMQAVPNQSNLSFSYLHNNISPDFVRDSYFKYMPILKNISTKNLIPIIDFEEFNEKSNEDSVELKYLMVHLFDILPRLSETAASTLLLRFPCFINEEITYHQFPSSKYMELEQIKRLISTEVGGNEGDQDDPKDMLFTKKFFTKHGWDFILMQKQGANNENKRASNFFHQREVPLRQSGPVEAVNLFLDEYPPKEDAQEQHSRYISPQKHTILKRNETINEEKIFGNVLLAAYNYKKEFKVQYSLNGHTYSTHIESLFSASVDQVAKIIEQSDNIYNSNSLKELLHRKGLNMRFEWAVLTKLRVNTYRELVMIDILLRTMRKIINEEVKLKSKIHHSHVSESGVTTHEEFYQGNQLDNYKEVITFYMNALLKRKFCKYKQVFDETLLGLFLSRMSILGIIYSLELKKEEFIYLESKDILEDIIEAPSKNPVLFINAVQTYFKIDFKPEFLRICRQDKHLMLSKSQPVTVNDIKMVGLRPVFYFNIKEQAYFMLARQITHHSKSSKSQSPSRIKTKADKDKLQQSFQKPRNGESTASQRPTSSRRGPNSMISGIGPQGLNNDSQDQHDSKTLRNHDQSSHKESLNTIRNYQNINKDTDAFNSPPLNTSKLTNTTSKKNESIIDLSKLSKRNNFKPTQVQEIILPSIMYKLKTFLSNNNMHYFDESSKTYVGDTMTVLKSYYEMPNVDIVNEWVICMESLLKDVYSVSGTEQVLLEAFVYQAILIYFFENDPESLFKVLAKIRDTLFVINYCSPETIVMIQILTGMFFEDQKDSLPIEAEKSYLTSLICLFQLYGDPRGRGNIGVPYTLFLTWKLSLLSLAEDKKLHDSEFAEEIFDACLKTLFNHRQLYKDQQLIVPNKKEDKTTTSAFETEVENQELRKQLFDIKKYKTRPLQITIASGMKSNYKQSKHPLQQASHVYISHNPNFHSNSQQQQPSQFKSKSHVAKIKGGKGTAEKDIVDPSEIDFEIEDENKNVFIDENFKNAEWYIGTCPFQHWSLYRQQIAQILQAHNSILNRNNQAQSQYQKQIYKEMLQKSLPKDIFYQWMIKFNPMMYQSGQQWSNQAIKEVVFCQNQQMVSSSGTSVVMSSHNMSQASLGTGAPTSAKEKRNTHLGSYSQILGKESGGISKQDMSGVVFSWGTDSSGQLGLDILNPNTGQNTANLKVLYPRMVVSLRDEIIKEICCGHSHTLVINIHGQVYAWGLNENAQLGLGPEAPQLVRKPILNPYLSNITKLSAGNEHSLAVTKNGELYIWGASGLTGLGDMNKRPIPTKMEFFNKTKILQAVCGGLHTVVVTKEGETYSWGSTEGGQLGLPLTMIQSLCTVQDMPVMTPQKIPKLIGIQVIQIACGEAHSIAMSKEGPIYGWGMSNYGQLGLGFSSDSFEPGVGMEKSKVYEPSEITTLKSERIQRVICGATFTLFQTEKGDLYGCGMNDLGQLGLDTFMEEMQIATLERAKRGKHHQTSDVTLPTKVICFQGISLYNVACGENHALGVSGDEKNMLWAWGMYRNGQLGLGEVSMKMNPRPVQTLCNSLIQRIACGSMHSMALIGDSSQISTYSAQYYANNDVLTNYWGSDFRGLSLKDPESDINIKDDEVPDDGEGQVKNPK